MPPTVDKLRREDAEEEVDVFAQVGYSDDEDIDATEQPCLKNDDQQESSAYKENVQQLASASAATSTYNSSDNSDNVKSSVPGASTETKRPQEIWQSAHFNHTSKRIDISENTRSSAPYFQHERREAEPAGEEEEPNRAFRFRADEEDDSREKPVTTEDTVTKNVLIVVKNSNTKENEKWLHDCYEQLDAGGDPMSKDRKQFTSAGRWQRGGGRGGRGSYRGGRPRRERGGRGRSGFTKEQTDSPPS